LQHQPKSLDNFWSKCKLDDHSTDYPESSWASLIDFWFYLPYPEDCRQRFVDTLKVYYNGVDAKIKVLEEFECNYNGKNAIQWYTRETFLYNILNRALRQHSIQLMFLFGFFLQDIHRQLQYEYKKMKLEWTESKLTLYRGQLISSTELQEQKNPLAPPLFSYMGTKIINNSLFSTTSNRSLALFYINRDLDSRDIYSNQSVLFEIEVNMREEDEDSCCRRPFANISHLSQFESEEEILFMIGTRFRYDQKSIQYNADEHVWIFKLEMDNNNFGIYENELGCLCKRRALKRCIMLLTRDNRERWTSTPPVRLKVIFRELCEMYPTEITWISAMKCHCLAVYQQFKEEKYTKALTYYYEALKLWYHYVTDEELICLSDLGDIHYQIACCFNFEIKDLKKAKTHYDQSIHFYELAISEKFALSNYERVQVYNELALVYERRNRLNEHKIANYLTQIKYRELYFENAFRYYSPKDTISVWPVLELIAGSYEYVGEIDKAISYYETALALREGLATLEDYSKITYPLHNIQHLIDIYRNLIKLYMNHKHNYNLALNYRSILYDYELQLDQGYGNNGTEREKRLLANKHSDLADIYRGLNQYQLAYDHLQIALNEYEAMEPSNSIDCDITMVKKKINSFTLLLS
jgi:tetratricopeptide (TPR) repeat protein